MTHWYFVRDGHREGPVSAEFIVDELRAKHLTQQDLVWNENLDAWQPIADSPELTELAGKLPPPVPPVPAASQPKVAPTRGVPASSVPFTAMAQPGHPFALLQRRILGTVLDQLLLVVPGFCLGLIVLAYLYLSSENFDISQPDDFNRLREHIYLVGIVVNWLYCASFESSRFQATPGMILIGLRVGHANGERLSFVHATLRHFLRAFSWWFGWFPALKLPTRQTLHDIVTTSVVTDGHPVPDKSPFRPGGMV